LEPGFPGPVPQGILRVEEQECLKNTKKTLEGIGGDSTGIRERLRSESKDIGLGSRENGLQPV